MPRQARLDCPGTLHHVIIRGIEKKKIVLEFIQGTVFHCKVLDAYLLSQSEIDFPEITVRRNILVLVPDRFLQDLNLNLAADLFQWERRGDSDRSIFIRD